MSCHSLAEGVSFIYTGNFTKLPLASDLNAWSLPVSIKPKVDV